MNSKISCKIKVNNIIYQFRNDSKYAILKHFLLGNSAACFVFIVSGKLQHIVMKTVRYYIVLYNQLYITIIETCC